MGCQGVIGTGKVVWGKYERNVPFDDLGVFCELQLEEDLLRIHVPSRRADCSKVDGLKSCGKRDERDSNKRLKEVESHPDDLSRLVFMFEKITSSQVR